MADRTRDIWNDNDEEKPQKRSFLRNFLLFLTVLVLVLGVVLLAAWRDGTGFDALRRYLTYGSAVSGEGNVYSYDADSSNQFAAVGDDGLAVLSKTSLRLLGTGDSELLNVNIQMNTPALGQGGGRAVAYDIGGTELYVLDETGERLHLTTGGAIVSANLNELGMLAVTAQESGSKGRVSVYDADMKLLFEFSSRRRFVADACVSGDGKYLAAVTMGQENGVFVSNVVLYDLTQEDPAAEYQVSDGLVMGMRSDRDQIFIVSDTCMTVGNTAGEVTGTYSYGGAFLREYDLAGDDFAVLLLGRYQTGNMGRLTTVDRTGTEIASLEMSEEIREISVCGRYLSVLYADRLVIYNSELQVYATLHGPERTRSILTRSDGSVLMLSVDTAELFLP